MKRLALVLGSSLIVIGCPASDDAEDTVGDAGTGTDTDTGTTTTETDTMSTTGADSDSGTTETTTGTTSASGSATSSASGSATGSDSDTEDDTDGATDTGPGDCSAYDNDDDCGAADGCEWFGGPDAGVCLPTGGTGGEVCDGLDETQCDLAPMCTYDEDTMTCMPS